MITDKKIGVAKAETKKAVILPILSIFLVIATLFFVYSAQPTVAVPQATTGILIEHPLLTDFQVNRDVKLHFHLFNSTDGKPFLNTSDIKCIFHLYNQTGSHILKVNPVSSNDTYDWEQTVLGGNFTTVGNYAYILQCNNTQIGGFYNHDFLVTPSGNNGAENTAFFIFIIILFFALNLVSFFGKSIPLTILTGMGMIFLGVYLINNGVIIYRDTITVYIAYLTIAVGAITSMIAILEQLQENF